MHDHPHYKYRPRRRKKDKTCDTKPKIPQIKTNTLIQVETPEPSPCTSQELENYPSIEYNRPYPSTTHYLPTPDVSPTDTCHEVMNYQGKKLPSPTHWLISLQIFFIDSVNFF